MLSAVHTLCGVAGLVLGAMVFFNAKGGRIHRVMGTAYALSMVAVNVTALCIYHLTGRFNLFHVFALLSLAMVLIGWAQVLFRRRLKRWFYRHYTYMCWSYAGLVAATSNEAFVRVPSLKAMVQHRGKWVILAAQVVIVTVCAVLLSQKKNELLKRYAEGDPS